MSNTIPKLVQNGAFFDRMPTTWKKTELLSASFLLKYIRITSIKNFKVNWIDIKDINTLDLPFLVTLSRSG